MQVIAVETHFHDSTLRIKAEKFDHVGKIHEHIKPVGKREQEEKTDQGEEPKA